MGEATPFPGEAADSREAIMRSTWVAIEEHGYAGLSIQRIADEAGLSKSSVYHHFEDKDELLSAFVDFILAQFMDVFAVEAGDDPEAKLRTFVDLLIGDDVDTEQDLPEDKEAVFAVYVELRAQAVREPAIREQFTQADDVFAEQLAAIIRDGQSTGVFRDVDPRATARYLLTIIAGYLYLLTTQDAYDGDVVREGIDRYLEREVLVA